MPELPEVETVRRVIGPQIIGRRIERVDLRRPQIAAHPDAAEFPALLSGSEITDLTRRGKFLCLRLTDGRTAADQNPKAAARETRRNTADRLIIHLRMTGSLLATPSDAPLARHTHLRLFLGSQSGPGTETKAVNTGTTNMRTPGTDTANAVPDTADAAPDTADAAPAASSCELRFIDPRGFGRCWLLRAGEEDRFSGIAALGPEPDDPKLTGSRLRQACGQSRRAIKSCLLDQHVVAGIGNIYADEILFAAGIRPGRAARRLLVREWEDLARLIPERLKFFTEKNAISAADYLRSGGSDYRNTPWLNVYGRAGQPCRNCGQPLAHRTIGGRTSVYCPRCQR
ncbi:MAG: Fpg/Nei family DNA glycosylase [Anaerovoracaceae bacterium]|jgi:formamidopyrimidine-DNA glycosylase